MIKSVKFRYIFSKIEINSIINFILLFMFTQCSKNNLSTDNFEEVERVQEENQNNSEKKVFNFEKIACDRGFANEFPCKEYDLLNFRLKAFLWKTYHIIKRELFWHVHDLVI